MGIEGRYVETFAEGNLASMIDVSTNGDYKHFFFDVKGCSDGLSWGGRPCRLVTVKSHWDSSVSQHVVRKDKDGEFFNVVHSGMYQSIFKAPPEWIKVVPFKGERF
jgi:hypothetical protein